MNSNTICCSQREAFFLILILLTNKISTNLPVLITRISGTGATLTSIISGAIFLILLFFLTNHAWNKTNPDILSSIEKKWGSFGKYALSFVFLCYFALSTFCLLTEAADFVKLIAFPTTPFWFVAVFFVLSAVCAAAGGAKSLFRTSGFVALFFLTTVIFLTLSVLFQSDFCNLFPILGIGAKNTLFKGLTAISTYSDILLLFFVKPDFKSPSSARHTVLGGTITAIFLNLLIIFAYTAKIPYPISAQESFPTFLLLKEVYFGRFFQRMDAVFLLSSSLLTMFSLSMHLLLFSHILQRTFGINAKPVSIYVPGLILFFSAAALPQAPTAFFAVFALTVFAISYLARFFTRKEVLSDNEQ